MAIHNYGHIFMGVDYSTPPHELHPNALADASNVLPDASGLPTGRNGSVKLNSTSLAARITSVHEFRSGTATRDILASYSTIVGVYNSGTGEFVSKITGLTSNKMFQWANFAGKAIGVNEGTDAPQYWTDDSNKGDLAGSPPVGRTVTEWSNRLWFGGDSTNVAMLTGSALNDPTDYATAGAAGYVAQTIGDSKDPITGIFGFFDLLLVGKRNNIYKVSGAPATDASSLSIEPLYSKSSDNVGFTSPWAITQVGNDVIFLDGFDIKRLSGIQEFGDVEYASIIPHFSDYLKSIADQDYLQYTHFYHYKKKQQIWVSIPTGAATRYVFVLDYRFTRETGRYAFYPMGGLTVVCFGGVENGEVEDIYYGDGTGYAHQLDTGNDDNGVAVTRYFVTVVSGNDTTKDLPVLDRHGYRKQFDDSETFILPGQAALTMTPAYALNLMDSAQVRTSGNYTNLTAEVVSGWTGTGVKHKRLRFFGLSGNTLALKWTHATLAQNFTFYPSEIHYQWKSRNLIV